MGIKNRNIVLQVVLSLVTCGLYALYWIYCIVKDAEKVIGAEDILTLILCIFLPFIGFYLLEQKYAKACAEKGIEHTDNAIIYLVLGLVFPIAVPCLVQNELNKIADAE